MLNCLTQASIIDSVIHITFIILYIYYQPLTQQLTGGSSTILIIYINTYYPILYIILAQINLSCQCSITQYTGILYHQATITVYLNPVLSFSVCPKFPGAALCCQLAG